MKRKFDGNLVSLAKDLSAAREYLESVPEDTKWDDDAVGTLEEVRYQAIRLSEMADWILDILDRR